MSKNNESINKDTLKAVKAATTLVKYCSRYKRCSYKCIFYQPTIERFTTARCAINQPCKYGEINTISEV